jgi:hypothetical protein
MTRFSSKWILSHSTCTNFAGPVNLDHTLQRALKRSAIPHA